MTDTSNLLVLPTKVKNKDERFKLAVIFIDDKVKEYQADAFTAAEEVPGFIALWQEDPYKLVGFINLSQIKEIEILPDVNE